MIIKTIINYLIAFLVLWSSSSAMASQLALPTNLINDILSEAVPSAFSLNGISINDYEPYFEGDRPESVTAILEAKSLQWVRVNDVLVLPRARLRLKFIEPTNFQVSVSGFTTSGSQLNVIDFPVALLINPKNQIDLVYETKGVQKKAIIKFKMKPKKTAGDQRIYFDSSCSKYAAQAHWKKEQTLTSSWVYIGCRFVTTKGDQFRASSLEMYVIWDGVASASDILIAGIKTESTQPSLWPLRLGAQPGHLTLKNNQGEELELTWMLSERHYLGFLGVGIGPYASDFSGGGDFEHGVIPLITIYGAYFMNETSRIVGFDATSVTNRLWTDFGLYLSTENAKMFDQRLTMNLLFGGHILAFRSGNKTHAVPSFPQGFEFIYADAFAKGHVLSLGGFLYPELNGRSYYNLWVRWGGRIFGEINYLSAQESFGKESVSSKSLGVTFGFPIARFF